MSICLCNLTADTLLEHFARHRRELELASPDPRSFRADVGKVSEVLADQMDELPRPLDVLVGSFNNRRVATGVACHMWKGPLPKNSIFMVEEGLYITSPELTLLQQATQLHQARLCQMLGRYLGTWTPDRNSQTGQQSRAPLTSLESLQSFLRGMHRIHGMGNLKFAMAHTCEGAASAPETSLQLALTLPPELYGLDLPQPIMNYEEELSSYARKLYPHETIRIDLCWRAERFGLEYQGEEHGNQLGEDYARWFAAREERYELWFVAKEQLENAAQMNHIGHEVAKRLGIDINSKLWPADHELEELLDVLNGKGHPKPLGYKELRQRRSKIRELRRKL